MQSGQWPWAQAASPQSMPPPHVYDITIQAEGGSSEGSRTDQPTGKLTGSAVMDKPPYWVIGQTNQISIPWWPPRKLPPMKNYKRWLHISFHSSWSYPLGAYVHMTGYQLYTRRSGDASQVYRPRGATCVMCRVNNNLHHCQIKLSKEHSTTGAGWRKRELLNYHLNSL